MSSARFNYSYDSRKRVDIDRITRKYTDENIQLYDTRNHKRITELDRKVERPAYIFFWIALPVGILTFGTGLSLALVWEMYLTGSIVGLAGATITAMAFVIRDSILKNRRRRYRVLMEKLVSGS